MVEQLGALIRSGTIGPGTRLASEETMSREFGVSRTSVREAIRELVTLGLVERRSNRPHVVERLPDVPFATAARTARIRELFETRQAIEVPLAEYAAVRATAHQRSRIVELAARIAEATTIEALRPLDSAFHAEVAAAAGNALLAELHAKVLDAVFDASKTDTLEAPDRADHSDRAAKRILAATRAAHSAIADAIAAGDAVGAGAAARAHLRDVQLRLTPTPLA